MGLARPVSHEMGPGERPVNEVPRHRPGREAWELLARRISQVLNWLRSQARDERRGDRLRPGREGGGGLAHVARDQTPQSRAHVPPGSAASPHLDQHHERTGLETQTPPTGERPLYHLRPESAAEPMEVCGLQGARSGCCASADAEETRLQTVGGKRQGTATDRHGPRRMIDPSSPVPYRHRRNYSGRLPFTRLTPISRRRSYRPFTKPTPATSARRRTPCTSTPAPSRTSTSSSTTSAPRTASRCESLSRIAGSQWMRCRRDL
jgi:hypothetical protein